MPLPEERFLTGVPSGGDTRAAVVYPNTYSVGIASLGYQTIIRELIEHGGYDIRRFFFDSDEGGIIAVDGGSLRDADILLVSIAYELDYINLARMLIDSGIPPRSADRKGLPLVLVGGIAPSANPLPLWEIADAVYIGDSEVGLQGLMDEFTESLGALRGPSFAYSRDDLLTSWGERDFIFVPQLHEEERDWKSAVWAHHDAFSNNTGHTIIISGKSVWGNTFLTETSRGCETGCRFCLVGAHENSCLTASLDYLKGLIARYSEGVDGIGLIGSSVGTYLHLIDLVKFIVGLKKRVGLSSLNFRNSPDELLALLAQSGEHKITLAVESGSVKLQRAMGKVIPDTLVVDRLKAAYDAGLRSVKLYFITGLPDEDESDIQASLNLIQKIADDTNLRSHGGKHELSVGVSFFVPKRGTPWESKPMLKAPALKKRLGLFKDAISAMPYISLSSDSTEMSVFQGILSVGDKSTSVIILRSASAGDEWRQEFRNAAKETGWMDRIHNER